MKSTIIFNNCKLTLDASMRWLLLYKQAFGLDPLEQLFESTNVFIRRVNDDSIDLSVEDTNFLLRCVWSMAHNHDANLFDPMGFYLDNPDLDVLSGLKDITNLLHRSTASYVSNRYEVKGTSPSDDDPVIENFIDSGLRMGLSLSDTKELCFGQWVDLLTAHNNSTYESASNDEPVEVVKLATQADFNKFAKG